MNSNALALSLDLIGLNPLVLRYVDVTCLLSCDLLSCYLSVLAKLDSVHSSVFVRNRLKVGLGQNGATGFSSNDLAQFPDENEYVKCR